jgi:hypothetical protein
VLTEKHVVGGIEKLPDMLGGEEGMSGKSLRASINHGGTAFFSMFLQIE